MMQRIWTMIMLGLCVVGADVQAGLEILCTPPYVRPGDTFHINVMYTINEPIRADLHFDLVDEDTKQWVAGTTVALPSDTGRMSVPMTLPAEEHIPLTYIWKVYLSPHGEIFPNMMIEQGLSIMIDEQDTLPCPILIQSATVAPSEHDNDYLVIDRLSSVRKEGCGLSLSLEYRLTSRDHAIISVVVMDALTNEMYSPGPIHPIHRGQGKIDVNLSVPISDQPLYVETTLLPTGYAPWTSRLAEDRRYKNVCTVR